MITKVTKLQEKTDITQEKQLHNTVPIYKISIPVKAQSFTQQAT